MRRIVLIVVTAGVLAVAPRLAICATQDPVATFRSETSVVEVDTRVFDRQGQFVGDLSASEFVLYEDGMLQTIANVELVDVGTRSGLQKSVNASSDVSSNARATVPGRHFLLVLDDLQVSTWRSKTVKEVARRFVESTLGPTDYAAIVTTSGRTGPSHGFTTNRKSLLDAIDRFTGQQASGTTAPADPLATLAEVVPKHLLPPRPPGDTSAEEEEGQVAVTMARGLKIWVNALSGLSGRAKSVVMFSEGIRYNTFNPFGRYSQQIEDLLRETIAAATRHNVTIYTIDPRGLSTDTKSDISPVTGPDDDFFSGESMRMQMSLRYLAAGTGGFALTNTNDFSGAFRRIAADTSQYYILRYSPRESGQVIRQLRVQVTRPGLKVQSRRQVSFVMPKPANGTVDSRDRLAQLLSSELPQPGLPIAVTTNAWRRAGKRVGVLVTVGIDAADAWPTGSSTTRSAAVRFIAIDKNGTVKGGRTLTLPQVPQDASDFRVVSELELPPGEFQLRVAAVAGDFGKSGSVVHDVVVPDLNARPVVAGDPTLTTRSTIGRSFVFLDIQGPRPFAIPTTLRSLPVDDELRVSGGVFANGRGTRGPTRVTASMQREDGTPCSRADNEIEPEPDGQLSYALTLPVTSCGPGRYVLRVNVQQAARRNSVWTRSIPIDVLPDRDRDQEGPVAATPERLEELSAGDSSGPVTLAALLSRSADYLRQFARDFSNVVAEEQYLQEVAGRSVREDRHLLEVTGRPAPTRRELVSDFLLVKLSNPDMWVPFRDVFEVDRQPVRERQERITTLLLNQTGSGLAQARAIVNESTRFNIGEIERAINNPLFALSVVNRELQPRFRFRLGREEPSVGQGAWRVDFEERSDSLERTPRSLVQSPDGRPLFSSGHLWIEASGRIAKTEVLIRDRGLKATVTTSFRPDDRFDLNVPDEMREDYTLPSGEKVLPGSQGTKHVTGHATYGRFRRFDVTSTETVAPPPSPTTSEPAVNKP